MNLSRQDLLILGALLFAALGIGWIASAFGWSLFAAALVWAIVQARELRRFERWSLRPLSRPANELDSWQNVAYRLFRSLRASRQRNARTLKGFRGLRAITDALPDAAIVLNAAGNIVNLNRAARELLHLNDSDRGNHLNSLVRQPDLIALVRGQVPEAQIEFTSPFDESTRLEARRIAIDEAQTMILVRDVTQLNRLLSMRQDFIANVSHELRTPLTVIVGYIETLLNEDLDRDTTRGLISKLLAPTTRMRALVDDLLLLTRLEASPSPAGDELTPIDMGTLIAAIVADARALSGGRHCICVDVASRAMVTGIENELHSACLNLLTNAVRYSPDGGDIEVSWRDIADGARFAVEDHGMGIPREHLARITERFYRVDLAKSRVRGGTGLGLAIVKHVLKRHNTRLQVISQLAKGSTFFFDIPATQLTH